MSKSEDELLVVVYDQMRAQRDAWREVAVKLAGKVLEVDKAEGDGHDDMIAMAQVIVDCVAPTSRIRPGTITS